MCVNGMRACVCVNRMCVNSVCVCVCVCYCVCVSEKVSSFGFLGRGLRHRCRGVGDPQGRHLFTDGLNLEKK